MAERSSRGGQGKENTATQTPNLALEGNKTNTQSADVAVVLLAAMLLWTRNFFAMEMCVEKIRGKQRTVRPKIKIKRLVSCQ